MYTVDKLMLQVWYPELFIVLLVVCECVLLHTVSAAVVLMVPSELDTMQVNSPESWMLTG